MVRVVDKEEIIDGSTCASHCLLSRPSLFLLDSPVVTAAFPLGMFAFSRELGG